MTVFDDNVIGLTLLDWERLVVGSAASEAKAEAATTAALSLFNHMTIHLEHIAVIGRERIFHVAREGGLILSADAYRERVLADALGKTPRAEGREVQLVIVTRRSWLATQLLIVIELYEHTLAIVEVLQMMYSSLTISEFAGFLIENISARHRLLNALEQRVLVFLGRSATVVTVQQFHIIGIRTNDSDILQTL